MRKSIDPEAVGRSCGRLASVTRSALTGRAFGLAAADLSFDLLSLDLMFLAFRYQPGFGPLAVAYATANIASALPLTSGGLGVIEVTLVAITAGFGAPRATAVVATLAYRLVNYWLPLPSAPWPICASGSAPRIAGLITRGQPGRPRYQRPGRADDGDG